MISVVEFKGCVANASIFGIIVSKLYYRNKLCLIILIKINKGLKVSFYYALSSFNLAVCLQIEDRRKF